jgi:hypothetical protein
MCVMGTTVPGFVVYSLYLSEQLLRSVLKVIMKNVKGFIEVIQLCE